jgi:hypothetical protein
MTCVRVHDTAGTLFGLGYYRWLKATDPLLPMRELAAKRALWAEEQQRRTRRQLAQYRGGRDN